MDNSEKKPADNAAEAGSLEGNEGANGQPEETVVLSDAGNSLTGENLAAEALHEEGKSDSKKPEKPKKFKKLGAFLNVYLIIFFGILIVSIVVIYIAYKSSKTPTTTTINPTTLSQSTLQQLANSDVSVGDAKQILNVQSNAVFAGSVLVKGGLSVAGSIQTSSPLSLPGLTVGGSASIDQLQVTKSLSVSGTASLQNGLTVAKNLNVSGDGTFTGNLSATQITVNSFQLNSDLTLTHHIVAGGGTPSRSTGTALGSGGTSSVSGSDTAGSIAINTGSSPAAGCFITVNFINKYNNTPHVIVTPINSGAGGLPFYVTRTTSGFSVCTTAPAPANDNFGFDYIVIG